MHNLILSFRFSFIDRTDTNMQNLIMGQIVRPTKTDNFLVAILLDTKVDTSPTKRKLCIIRFYCFNSFLLSG